MNTEDCIYKLKEVANVGSGNSAPQKKELFKNGTFPFIRTSDVGNIHIGSISESRDNLNEEGIKGLKLFKNGTILFPKSGASTFLNHRVIMEIDGYVASHLATIKAKEDQLDDRYLLYFLQTLDSKSLVQDSSYPSLKVATIEDIELRLPPLPVQKQIVEKLDAAFADIDKAISAEEIKITEITNLINRRFDLLFYEMKTKYPNMELREVSDFQNGDRGKNYPSKKHQVTEGIPFINAGDFSPNGEIKIDKMAFVTEERFNLLGSGKIKLNDILFCLRGSLGKCALNKDYDVGAIASSLVIMRAKKEILLPEYLFAFLRSGLVKKYINETKSGTAQPNLSAKVVSSYKIPIPPIKKQKEIIEKLNLITSYAFVLKNLTTSKSKELKHLKTSILNQAFSGELTKDSA